MKRRWIDSSSKIVDQLPWQATGFQSLTQYSSLGRMIVLYTLHSISGSRSIKFRLTHAIILLASLIQDLILLSHPKFRLTTSPRSFSLSIVSKIVPSKQSSRKSLGYFLWMIFNSLSHHCDSMVNISKNMKWHNQILPI